MQNLKTFIAVLARNLIPPVTFAFILSLFTFSWGRMVLHVILHFKRRVCALNVESVNYKVAFRIFNNSVHTFISFIGFISFIWMHKLTVYYRFGL